MSQSVICLIIFIATLVLYAINKFSIGAVALVSMIALVLSGSLDASTAVGYFGNPNGIITIGMFIVVTGFSRTQLVNRLAAYVYKISGGSFLKCMRILIVIYFLSIPFINSGLARIIMGVPPTLTALPAVWWERLSKLVGMGLYTVLNYFGQRFFAFRRQGEKA